VFHPLWCDSRTGIAHVWTAPVTVTGKVREVTDVTDVVKINFHVEHFNEPSGEAEVAVSIENISDRPLRGPFVLQLLGERFTQTFTGEYGPPAEHEFVALNADNAWEGAGATWEIRAGSSPLKPGKETPPRNLKLRLVTDADKGGYIGVRVLSAGK
jgi:hypothetical protein